MPLLSAKDVLNLKLGSLRLDDLKALGRHLGIVVSGSSAAIIRQIFNCNPDEAIIDQFIKQKFTEIIEHRRAIISDEDLIAELMRVKTFSWGAVQGQLDQKIQSEYVRRMVRFDDLLQNIRDKLHGEVTNYVVCTWFNHWTTVLIEDHISTHPRVIPTVKSIKGVDIFFDGQPFDLKVTYLPRSIDPETVINNPAQLAVWMYENQGAQRFGADNRIFVVLIDEGNRDRSWELKRNFNLVFERIDRFFNEGSVTTEDEVIFTFNHKTYTAVSKVLIIATRQDEI